MKKINLTNLILLATLCVVTYKCYVLFKAIEKSSFYTAKGIQKAEKYRQEIALNAIYETYASKNAYIDFFQDETGFLDISFHNIDRDSLLRNTKMVMRIPSKVCNPCYDSIYAILFKNLPKEKIDKFVIIVDLNILKDYGSYFKELGLGKNVFGITADSHVSEELDKQSFPYLVQKNEGNGKFRFLFVINKDSKVRLNEYLKITKKY